MKIKNLKLNIIAVIVLLHVQPGIVSAQEHNVTPTPKPVEYTLPYPGLLPDHPLYFLRAVRDTMQTFFVSDPVNKAEFYLLQADKSISASVLLSDKKETQQLSAATAVESQDYFDKALESVANAKKQGLSIHEVTKKLVLANEKHQETLAQLRAGAAEEYAETFKHAEDKALQSEKKVKGFLPAK